MSPWEPLISLVIPNWNGAHHLPDCLNSLRRQRYRRFEVILVDNGSNDGSLALLAREYPEVHTIPLTENRGFAPACNLGMRAARGEILVLLNNDTEVTPGWLEARSLAHRRRFLPARRHPGQSRRLATGPWPIRCGGTRL